jgi:hypothetical protein
MQVNGLQGDVNGDFMTDLVSVNEDSVWVTLSTGGGFGPPTQWWSTPAPTNPPGVPGVAPFGARATLLGDVTGTGKAALVAVNDDRVYVMTSTGTAFNPPALWSQLGVPFFGTRATLLADIRGIGRADLVSVNDTSIWVMLSTGTGFDPPREWESGILFFGSRATLLGDVTGSGKAALVAVNNDSVYVMISTGTAFTPAQSAWSSGLFYGDRGTLLGDVNNDGKMDLVAVNNDGTVWVLVSNGTAFVPQSLPFRPWLTTMNPPPFGTRATLLGGVSPFPGADLVAVNDRDTQVMLTTTSSFNPPSNPPWLSVPFYGQHATL